MIHYVRVAVALSRPPKIDEWRRYCVVAPNRQEAELIAQQIAACSSVMPVESQWESSHRAGPVEPFGVLGCRCRPDPWSEDVGDEDVWDIAPTCPHHSEDTAAWAALDGFEERGLPTGQNGKGAMPVLPELFAKEAEMQAMADALTTEPAECPPGVHSMFDFCPGRAICEDGWQEENPPTPETANAGGPDIDDTTATTSLPYVGIRKITLKVCPCGDIAHAPDACRYATGVIVPDELKRQVDTVKVSSCTCERVDTTAYGDGEKRTYIRGRNDGDCDYHGDLAQIRGFGHIDVGDRLRVNDFGIWSIERAGGIIAGPGSAKSDLVPGLLPSTGVLTCTVCDDWSHGLGYTKEDSTKAFLALHSHRNTCTEKGPTECRSLSQQQPMTWWARLARWAMSPYRD